MNTALLRKHIKNYVTKIEADRATYERDFTERLERTQYYQSWTEDRILKMDADDLYDYFSKLWAMLIWGNKKYVVNKLIKDNSLVLLTKELAQLIWGDASIEVRWEHFRKAIKGIGPAMMSEVLCYVYPKEYMVWNRRAYVAYKYLGIEKLPRYSYQFTGKKYIELSAHAKQLAKEMEKAGIQDPTLLTVDYFIWEELQVEDNLSQIHSKKEIQNVVAGDLEDKNASEFIHNEVRDKLADIGLWLGFKSDIETKVADGSIVDTTWEATIGNMGRVIYVFEVQTKGSIDSLIVNLLKALNNPAVQGVVAVSDSVQLEKIKKHAAGVTALSNKLKCWDYLDVLQNHEYLEAVNESINRLGLVPEGF